MKIIIDHEQAISACLGSAAPVLSPLTDEVALGIQVEQQLLSRWCWAALGASLSAYYHGASLRQDELAGRVLGLDCTGFETEEALREQCNINFNLDKVLELVGCFSHWSPGKPPFERLQFEINNGHPVCCRVSWYEGDAHYILIRGYAIGEGLLYVEDPLHGPARVKYDDLPRNYHLSGGVWTETYWTRQKPFV